MNRFLTSLVFLLCITSCSHQNKSYENSAITDAPSVIESISIDEAYNVLITKKLLEHIEKERITKNHPEFDRNQTVKSSLLSVNDSILNISIIDEIQNPNFDSIALKTVVSYHTNTHKDTIISKIKRIKIQIDEEEIISSKVTFEKKEN